MDARRKAEFSGAEIGKNPRGGAIPSATNLFWENTIEGEYQSFRTADELTDLFGSHGLTKKDNVITYCQGGGQAAHELFVMHLMGFDHEKLSYPSQGVNQRLSNITKTGTKVVKGILA